MCLQTKTVGLWGMNPTILNTPGHRHCITIPQIHIMYKPHLFHPTLYLGFWLSLVIHEKIESYKTPNITSIHAVF